MRVCPHCGFENPPHLESCARCDADLADQTEWYYCKQGGSPEQRNGPLTWEQLLVHAESEALCPEDFVWNPALPEWVPAERYPDLFSAQPAQQPAQESRRYQAYEREEYPARRTRQYPAYEPEDDREFSPRELNPLMGRCPDCGSTRIQVVTEGETKGFGTGKGCCGAILLGPIGFLLGLCGMGKGKTEAIRMCMNCGAKF